MRSVAFAFMTQVWLLRLCLGFLLLKNRRMLFMELFLPIFLFVVGVILVVKGGDFFCRRCLMDC